MGALMQSLQNLGVARLTMAGGLVLMLVAFAIFLFSQLGVSQMSLLYGDLTTDDSARIVSQLESLGEPYEIRQNGSQVMVAADRVARLRLSMAEQGLPSGGSIGYEIFDQADSLGTTNFVQNVNLVRAMEGELSRTISSLPIVHSARVHVVLPRRELFSRTRQEPTASIVLDMAGNSRMTSEQVAAIQHLVAAAVPGLNPLRISIVDERGTLLARGFEETDPMAAMAAKSEERRRNYEARLAHAIESLLEKSVGYGNVQAEVTANIDYDVVNTNEESFDPEGQVVRSTQTVDQSSSSQEGDSQAVSVATNLPDADTGLGGGASANSTEARIEETVNFEISKKVINHVRDTGLVNRLSVAVLVDGVYTPNADGELTYAPRDNEQMELLATLVRSAIGFNADRGDVVEVINMQFAEIEAPPEPPLELFFGMDKNDLLRLAQYIVVVILFILVILLIVRPVLSRMLESYSATTAAARESQMLAEHAGTPALTGPEGSAMGGDRFEELIDIDRVEGRVRASSVKKVGEIVQKHPEEALSIVRAWMYQES